MKTLFACLLLFACTFIWAQEHEEQLYSLYFENDKATLTVKHTAILDSINTLLNKDELDVHIKGYANHVGNEAYNLKLSAKRAASVTSQLRAFTIISSQGYGELAGNENSARRVDIFIHHKEDHIPEKDEIVIAPIKKAPITPNPIFEKDLKKGDKITIQGIMFYQDRDVMMDESRDAMDNLLAFLEQNKNISFKLIGHICCGDYSNPGRDFRNIRTGKNNLSEARAKAVYNYLGKKGINKKRMRYIGMAFRQPTGENNTEDRRVEIEITSIK